VEGVAKVGETLTATITPSGATASYQWMRSDSEDKDGTYTNISGATEKTYKLVAADVGKYIKVKATGTGDYKGTVESEPVGPVEEEPDTTAPEFKGVTPEEGKVELPHDANFILTVEASDENLYELEVDHNIADLPEFSVYASEEDPYGGQGAAFESYGVEVTYDAAAQKWTIDFGEAVTRQIVANGGITFYLVIKDVAGNQWGSMYDVTDENTFVYHISQLPAPEPSTYKFSYETPADVVAGQEVEVPVTFKTDVKGDIGYEGVRFKFTAEGPGDVTFKAVDSNNDEYTFTNEGYWGPPGGFDLPAEYEATTEWTLVFSEAGDYTITFSLIDADTEEVIAGITKTVEITVAEPEPVASTYKFSYEVPADVVAGQEVEVPVTFETDVKGDIGYEGVRFKFTAQGPGDVTFKAVDSNEVEHTFTNEGYWGPDGGFDIPAEYEATTDWTLVFSAAGEYTITFSLIDADTEEVIAGITKTVEITVAEPEPVASTYKFSYEVPADVVAGQEVEVPVTFKTDVKGDIGYDGVRFKFTAQGPGDVTFKAVDSNEVEHTFTNEGYWGPDGGFDIPAEYEATTDWTLVFSAAGEYTITFSLIDADTEEVIAGITKTVEITVAEPEPVASTYKFSYEVPDKVIAGQEVEVPVTFKTDVKGDIGYDGVRFKFTAQGPGDVTFKAVDSNEVEHTFTNEGYWGPDGGFDIPAEYEATTDWTLVFSKAGNYTITFSLIDADTEEVIAGITDSVTIEVEKPVEPSKPVLEVTGPDEEVSADAENFTVTFVATHDKELAYLEIDHNLGKHGELPAGVDILPEFKLYPDAANPWGSEQAAQEAEDYGVSATYDAANTTWTVTFGGEALAKIRSLTAQYTDNEFKIYSLVCDVDGVKSGSMYDGTYETTIVTLVDPLQEVIDGYSISVSYEAGTITAEFDKYLTELPAGLEGYKIDVLITLGAALPEGTEIEVRYNDGDPLPLQDNWRDNFNEANQNWLGEGILDIGGAKPFVGGEPGKWTITISGNEEDINTTVKIESAISNDKFETWTVIADAQVDVVLAAEKKEYHTYKFEIKDLADKYIVSEGLANPSDENFEGLTPVKLSIVVDENKDKAYEGKVRVAPVGANGLQLWAKDSQGKWYDINVTGWGPPEGFVINPELVTPVYVIVTEAFDETVTLSLVDVTGDYGAKDNIIISQEVAVKAVVDEQAQALAAVNDYLTPANYNYAGAPDALEGHLAVLGLDVGEDSAYAALDKTAIGGKNRKTAVFYDLNNNKPDEGYDLATLTTYFNDIVATRLVTQASMDKVNNAQTIEDLEGISFVTMLLDRFESVSYATHSGIPVAEKIATLQGLVERYNSLDEAGQAAVLQKLLDKRPEDGYARSQATTDALAEALTEVEEEQDAIAQALAAVNDYLTPANYNYAGAPDALEGHLAVLGLDVGEDSAYAALDKTAIGGKNRKTAVFYDLNQNKPDEGYDLATLTTYFNDIVATRLVTEKSMDLVNNAQTIEDLEGISFVTMLLDRFRAVSYQTHSGIPVEEKIATLQGLVERYNSLDEAGQAAVLQKLLDKRPEDGYARSQATTDALAEALTEVEEEQDAIAQALAAVNDYLTPANYNYAGAPDALEGHLAVLGLDVGEDSAYAALDKTAIGGKNRKTAVFYDLNQNKPDEGYDLATLTTYFNDIVATRLVTEKSMDLVNNAQTIEDLEGISFVTMLLDRFRAVSYQTHSGIPVEEKIATLQGLVERYNSLDEAGQAAVLQKLLDKRPEDGYARSQATTDALAEALTEVEEEPFASTYKFSYEVPADVVAGQEVEVPVTFKTDVKGDIGYEGVRFKFTAEGPGDVTFKAVDSNEVEHTFTNEGYWGPDGGFDIPAEYTATTDWTLVFSKAGDYTITFSLIDADTEEVIAGITKTVEITVAEPEPVASTYKFSYEVPADVVAGQEVEVPVTFKTDVKGDIGYEGVRFKFTAEGPGDVTFKAVDSNEVEHTFTNEGYWGPDGGFDIPAEYTATTDWTLVFSKAGDYTITFSLIDADTEEVIAGITKTVEITVAEPEPVASTYKFSYEVPADVVAGQEVEVPVTFKTDVKGDIGYEGVRFKFTAEGPGDVTFKAVDSNEVEHTFTNQGYWGPAGGFNLPADYSATTEWKLVFSASGQYTITFSLIDAATEKVVAGISDTATIEVGEAPEEPAVEPTTGVSPSTEQPISGEVAFTFGFKSVTGNLQELELDIYLGDNTGENRDYANHLGVNLPAGSDAVANWVDQVVAGYAGLDEKYHAILAAAGYDTNADEEANKATLKNNIFYTAGEDGAGTWTIKLDTAVLGEKKIEFLVTVRDDAGAQWGNNNYVAYPDEVKAYLYNVTLPVASTYKFSYDVPAEVIAGRAYTVPVSIEPETVGDFGYNRVRFDVAVTTPEGATLQLLATDTNGVEHDVAQIGYWGPENGFPIAADYSATTDFTAIFSDAGEYTITFSLVDLDAGEALVTETVNITVREYVPMAVSSDVPVFKVGKQQEYEVSTVANDDAGRMVRAYFEIPSAASVEYYEVADGNWYPLGNEYGPAGGFPVADATSKFRAVFSEAGTYNVTVVFKEVGTDAVVATYDMEVTVEEYVPMEITADLPEFTAGVPQTFTIGTIANDDAGRMVRAHFTLPEGVTVEYQEGGEGEWIPLVDVFGPAEGFPLGDITTTFRGTFAAAGEYTATVVFKEVGTGEVLGSKEITANVVPALPAVSTYAFEYSELGEVVAGEDVEASVSLKTDELGQSGYEAVLFEFAAQGPGDVTFTAEDSAGQTHTFTNSGTWGPPGGFALPAQYNETTDWTLNFAVPGEYTITFKLVDVANEGVVIVGESVEIIVKAAEAPGTLTLEGPEEVTASTDLVYYTLRWDGAEEALFGSVLGWVVTKDGEEIDRWQYTYEAAKAAGKIWVDEATGDICASESERYREPGTYVLTGTLSHPTGWEVTVTKTVTVKPALPAVSTYAFEYSELGEVVAGKDVEASVSLRTDELGQSGYEAVLFEFAAQGPGDVTFTAEDSAGQTHTFTNSGTWGPPGGFALPAQYNETTDWTLNFAVPGEYTITFKLVDVANEGAVIVGESVAIIVVAAEAPGTLTLEGPEEVTASTDLVYYTLRWDGAEEALFGSVLGWVVTKDGEEIDRWQYTYEAAKAAGKIWVDEATGDICASESERYREPGTYVLTGTLSHPTGWEVTVTKTVTVKPALPAVSTYAFEYSELGEVVAGKDVEASVSLKTDELGQSGYEAVLFEFAAQGPGDVTFTAEDSAGQTHTFTNSGTWGPPGGFALPAQYNETTDWTLNFAVPGEYTITFKLVDVANEGAVIVKESVKIIVKAAEAPGTLTLEGAEEVTASDQLVYYTVRWYGNNPNDLYEGLSGATFAWTMKLGEEVLEDEVYDFDQIRQAGKVWEHPDGDSICVTISERYRVPGTYTLNGILTHPTGWKLTVAKTVVVLDAPDTTAPVFKGVEPGEGKVELAYNENFVWSVQASDENLYELEVDHNIAELPEFSVYASEEDPYGGEGEAFEAFGVEVRYDAGEQKWTIDFGPTVTETILEQGGITFYLVIKDKAGNQWGSMYDVTDENTFVYEVTRLPDPDYQAVATAIAAIEAGNYQDLQVDDVYSETDTTDAVQSVVDGILANLGLEGVTAEVTRAAEGVFTVTVRKGDAEKTTTVEATFVGRAEICYTPPGDLSPLPTVGVKVKVDGEFITDYTIGFDGVYDAIKPDANGIAIVPQGFLSDLSRVRVAYQGRILSVVASLTPAPKVIFGLDVAARDADKISVSNVEPDLVY
jgi:hypothetical protein